MSDDNKHELNDYVICPYCHDMHDSAASTDDMDSLEQPQPGSLNICTNCGNISVYDEIMELRLPTPEEEAEMLADADFQDQLVLMRAAIAITQAGRRGKK